MRPRRQASAALVCALAIACSEAPPLDTTRRIPERGTLGEEIFRLVHRDLERDDPRRAEGFMLAREGLVGAVDHLFPEAELADVQSLLIALLPFYDDETIPDLSRRFAAVAGRLEANPDALASFAALANREGYVDTAHAHALALRLASYPRFRELATKLIDVALAHDGLDERGDTDPAEPDEITRLLSALAKGLREAEISEDDARDIVIIADLLLSEDARLASSPAPEPGHAVIVARDIRGMAQVASRSRGVPAPFSDVAPADGEPDVDEDGRFVDVVGHPIVLPPFGAEGPRDARGRAIDALSNELVYEYVELDRTVLAGLLRDGRDLFADEVPMKLVRSLEALLGERTPEGVYSPANNRLLDLVHAGAITLDGEELPDLLEVTRRLLETHESELGYVLVEMERQLDIADGYDVSLKSGSTFFDEIMSVVRKILREPNLAEDLLDALEQDPAFLGFPRASATLAEAKKVPILEADLASGAIFATRVDRSRPDTRDNQSHHQRLLHLIADTKGARYEPKLVGVPLGFIFEISDLAEFYMLSIIGEAQVPALVARLTGLAERPTPEQLAHFINSDQTFGNPVGNEGIEVKDNDGDTLFAATASGMTDALAPLIRVFHRHGKLDLLFEAFNVLHLHYASDRSDFQSTSRRQPRYSKLSGISYYEPLLIDVYRNTKVIEAVKDLLVAGRDVRTSAGRPARDVLLAFGRRFLGKDPDLRTRDGKLEVNVDGERISPLSPFDLIRGARAGIHGVVDRRAKTKEEWKAVVSALHEKFMKTEESGPGAGRFSNPRTAPVLLAALRVLEARAKAHDRAGDLHDWLRADLPKTVEDAIASDELPAALDLVHLIEDDEALSEMLEELRDQLLAEDDGFGDLLAVLGDGLASAKDARYAVPFARFLGAEVDPQGKLLFQALKATERMLEVDAQVRLLDTARRGIELSPAGGLYIDGITRAIRQANRTNPVDTGPVAAPDILSVAGAVGRYLLDEEQGLEKFYEIVEERK